MTISEAKIATGAGGFFLGLMLVFWSAGYSERTETPPLMRLTLSQAGCEYVSRSGISAEVKNGICEITARYRKFRLSDGGRIELPGAGSLQISGGQVVGQVELDDGSDEPWTAEHKRAVFCIFASFLLMAVSMWIMSQGTRKGNKK